VNNTSPTPVDVTILHINGKFGIVPLFPTAKGFEFNRIAAGKTRPLPDVVVDEKTTGREYLVVVTVKGQGEDLMDFVALAQPSIEGVRGTARTRGSRGHGALASPVGKLLLKAMHGQGETPHMKRKDFEDFSLELIPVQILPGKRPASER
jgi:hypothetical protein